MITHLLKDNIISKMISVIAGLDLSSIVTLTCINCTKEYHLTFNKHIISNMMILKQTTSYGIKHDDS